VGEFVRFLFGLAYSVFKTSALSILWHMSEQDILLSRQASGKELHALVCAHMSGQENFQRVMCASFQACRLLKSCLR
jgi:hypothetical protein